MKRFSILSAAVLGVCALLAIAGAQAIIEPIVLVDVKSNGTSIGYFKTGASTVKYWNFLDGAVFNSTTKALEIGGLLDIGPTALPTAVPSATTIAAPSTGNVFHVTGTTTIATITTPFGARSGCVGIIPDGIFATNTAGNIALASTSVVNKLLWECYDPTSTKWYPSY